MDDRVIPEQTIYVTFDIDEAGGMGRPFLYRVAKKIQIQGILLSWEVGEFKMRGVEEIYGVHLTYRSALDASQREEIIDTSPYAQNVQVFVNILPLEYQEALKNVA